MTGFNHIKTPEVNTKRPCNQKGMLLINPAQHPYFLWQGEKQLSKSQWQHPSNSASTHLVKGKDYVFAGLSKRKRRGHNPQWTTIVSPRWRVTAKGLSWQAAQQQTHTCSDIFCRPWHRKHMTMPLSAFQKQGLFDEAPSIPLFSSLWYLKLLSTQYGGGESTCLIGKYKRSYVGDNNIVGHQHQIPQ